MFGSRLFGPSYHNPLPAEAQKQIKPNEEKIANSDPASVIKNLTELSQEEILKMARDSAPIKKLCETNAELEKLWIDTITKEYKKTPTQVVDSPGGDYHPVFHHYASAYFVNAFISYEHLLNNESTASAIKANIENLLNEACKLGSYYGILRRCKRNLNSIKESNVELIINDAVRLTQLYGAIGYLRAGSIFLQLSNYFNNVVEDTIRGAHFFEQGVKNYYCALLLKTDDYSNQLTNSLTAGGDLASTFASDDNSASFAEIFKDNTKVETMLRGWVKPDTFTKLVGEANTEVESIFKKHAQMVSGKP